MIFVQFPNRHVEVTDLLYKQSLSLQPRRNTVTEKGHRIPTPKKCSCRKVELAPNFGQLVARATQIATAPIGYGLSRQAQQRALAAGELARAERARDHARRFKWTCICSCKTADVRTTCTEPENFFLIICSFVSGARQLLGLGMFSRTTLTITNAAGQGIEVVMQDAVGITHVTVRTGDTIKMTAWRRGLTRTQADVILLFSSGGSILSFILIILLPFMNLIRTWRNRSFFAVDGQTRVSGQEQQAFNKPN